MLALYKNTKGGQLLLLKDIAFKIVQQMSSEQGNPPVEEDPEEKAEEKPEEAEPVEQEKPASIEEVPKEEKEEKIDKKEQEIGMNEIVKEKEERIAEEEPRPSEVLKKAQPPVIVNPIHYYKGNEKFDWRVQSLDATACIQKIQIKPIPQVDELSVPNDMSFEVVGTTNVKGHIFYNVLIKDPKGSRQVSRRYTEYLLCRSKLLQLWPCMILASLPSKTLIGVSEAEVIRSRSKYIVRFLRSLCRHEPLYESEEVQTFLNEASQQKNWQHYFSELVPPKYPQLLQKYKKHYTDEYVYSQRQQFMYRKDQMPVVLDKYVDYFSTKKMDLMDYCSAIRRMAESKQNYYRAISKLKQALLPDYEDHLYRWIYGESLPQPPPSIMERISLKTKKKQQEGEGKETTQTQIEKFGLYNSEAYRSKLEDTALLTHNYNASSWYIYDTVKFDLKEIDSVITAIEQAKALQRQMDYLKRTIAINKEQVEALNNNKKTLKTFFMEGTPDQKKTKLANDSHILQEQLEKYTELYYIMMVLLEKQLQEYHRAKAEFYRKSMTKAFGEEISLVRTIMDFHIYEEQLFAKERLQRVAVLKNQEEQESKQREQIKQ